MTLFYSEIDTSKQRIRWVRAGHDPAFIYDPVTNAFEELKGPGLALGVDMDWSYEENEKSALTNGQIIVIGTDGIWETHNARGEIFGKKSFFEIIRQNASSSARDIASSVVKAVGRFRGDPNPEDDMTLVMIKITE